MRWGRTWALAGVVLGAAATAAAAAPLARDFSAARPVNWISVAQAKPSQVWVETAAGGFLSTDGGRSFRAPLATSAFRRAQVAQATLLAAGRPPAAAGERRGPPVAPGGAGRCRRPLG